VAGPGTYREVVPKWTSPDAGDVTPNELTGGQRIRAGDDDRLVDQDGPTSRRDPWSVTAIVIAAAAIAG